jgi:hypothetical protein
MADRQVTCTTKAGAQHHPNETFITHIGGIWGKITEAEAIRDIESRTHTYYTNQGGRRADIEVVQGKKRKFLKTKADSYVPDNLLSLPHCT